MRSRIATIGVAAALAVATLGLRNRAFDDFAPGPRPPLVVAHRGGPSRFPGNTLAAVRGCVADGCEGIEVDVGLTADEVPVIAHDPWVSTEHCTRVGDATPLAERILLRELPLAELRTRFVCGGIPDPAFPEARVAPEPIATLDELIDAVRAAPAMVVYLDLKIEDTGRTADAATTARAVLGRWRAAAPPNPLWIEVPDANGIAALTAEGAGLFFRRLISAPAFDSRGGWTWIGLTTKLRAWLGLYDAAELTRAVGADGYCMPFPVWGRRDAAVARQRNVLPVVFGADDADRLRQVCASAAALVITDRPELGTCGAIPPRGSPGGAQPREAPAAALEQAQAGKVPP